MLRGSTVVISIRVEPRGMVQPITHNLVVRKQDSSTHTIWFTRCEGHKCSQADVRKCKLIFVFQDSSIPDV